MPLMTTGPPPNNRLPADTYPGASRLPGANNNTPEIVIDRHTALTPLPFGTKNTTDFTGTCLDAVRNLRLSISASPASSAWLPNISGMRCQDQRINQYQQLLASWLSLIRSY